MGIFSADSLSS